jgi:hypothetical protein
MRDLAAANDCKGRLDIWWHCGNVEKGSLGSRDGPLLAATTTIKGGKSLYHRLIVTQGIASNVLESIDPANAHIDLSRSALARGLGVTIGAKNQ